MDTVTEDLLSVPPLLFRGVRRKLIRAALSNSGVELTPHQFEIIKLLAECGVLHVAEIGDRLQIARPQMTRLLDSLEQLEIVERQTATTDRRTIDVRLTDKGVNILKEHKKTVQNAIKETLSGLTEEELMDLSASLCRIREILSKIE